MGRDGGLKLLAINSIATSAFDNLRRKLLLDCLRADTRLDVTSLSRGTTSVEFLVHEMGNAVEVVRIVKEAERSGYSGVLINCFLDPGLHEARECVAIPVLGAGQAVMAYAAMQCHKFAIIAPGRKLIPQVERRAASYGLERKVACILPMTVGVAQLQKRQLGSELLAEVSGLVAQAAGAGAEMVTFACTAVIGLVPEFQRHACLPLLDPSVVGVKLLEGVAEIHRLTGIAHSKVLSYAPPDEWPPFLR